MIFHNVIKHIIELQNLIGTNYFVSLYTNDDRVIYYKDSINFDTTIQFSKEVIGNIQVYRDIVLKELSVHNILIFYACHTYHFSIFLFAHYPILELF